MISGFCLAVRSEWLKRRRSLTTWLVVGSAGFIPVIIFLSRFRRIEGLAKVYQAPEFWRTLWVQSWEAMALMILPMAIMLIVSLITQIEDRSQGWKQLHATPHPLVTIFLAKLVVVFALVVLLLSCFTAAIYLCGILPPFIFAAVDPPVRPYPLGDVLKRNLAFLVDVSPIVALQYLLAMRLRAFLAPLGIGMAMWILSIGAMSWTYNYTIPYSYAAIDYLMIEYKRPMLLPARPQTIAAAYFLVFTAAGYALYVTRSRG